MNGLFQEVRCALPKDKLERKRPCSTRRPSRLRRQSSPARDLRSPLSFVSVSAIPTIVALMVSYAPARRAAKVDPILALRYE
jgi:hypothetical protein